MELNSSSIKISFPFAQFSGSILNLEAVFQREKFGCDPTHPNLKVEPQCMGGLEDHFPIEYGNKYGFHVKLKECKESTFQPRSGCALPACRQLQQPQCYQRPHHDGHRSGRSEGGRKLKLGPVEGRATDCCHWVETKNTPSSLAQKKKTSGL